MNIVQAQLVNYLTAIKGAVIVTLTTETEPAMRKTDNPFVGTVKRSRVNGVINWSYEKSVNRQRGREELGADFVAEPRKWGERLPCSPLVAHKDKLYLELKVERSLDHSYWFNGREVAESDLKPFFPVKKEGARQGVTKAIILRDYALDSIRSITVGGETYTIGHAEERRLAACTMTDDAKPMPVS